MVGGSPERSAHSVDPEGTLLEERGPIERIARGIGERTRTIVRYFVGS